MRGKILIFATFLALLAMLSVSCRTLPVGTAEVAVEVAVEIEVDHTDIEPAPQPAPAPEAPVVSQPQPSAPKILDSNPLVDEAPSSKGTLIAVVVLLLIAVAVVSYLVL